MNQTEITFKMANVLMAAIVATVGSIVAKKTISKIGEAYDEAKIKAEEKIEEMKAQAEAAEEKKAAEGA